MLQKIIFVCLTTVMFSCGKLEVRDFEGHESLREETPTQNLETINATTADVVAIPEVLCDQEKSDLEFANSVVQNLYGRDLSAIEKENDIPDINRETFVKDALASSESINGITRFISNLFLLSNIEPDADLDDMELIEDSVLVAHLRQEPIELVLRNLDKPWPWFFSTRDIYCTTETAKIYDYPLFEATGFVSCQLPSDRAGFLGLASVLRAVPSSLVSTNNNYKRVAFSVYLGTGLKLQAATNGPEGEGPGESMAQCVPTTDLRVDQNGLAFGTARVPTEGAVCASCHSRYNAPISIAFRRFREDGRTFSFRDIDELNGNDLNGASRDLLKNLLNENQSCWSAEKHLPPKHFNGVPGLGEILGNSTTLSQALGIQIPQMLGNVDSDDNMIANIKQRYEDGGQTLTAAMEGFFLSESFQCKKISAPTTDDES